LKFKRCEKLGNREINEIGISNGKIVSQFRTFNINKSNVGIKRNIGITRVIITTRIVSIVRIIDTIMGLFKARLCYYYSN
jgi:hypothetical protein